MKNISTTLLILIVTFFLVCCDQSSKEIAPDTGIVETENVVFDSIRAQKVGADEYGMKQYVLALLKRGPNRDRPKEEVDKLQRAHLDNITKLAEAGKLVLAGPFISEGDLRGIYIFNVKTIEEAKALVETDPAIQEESLTMELIPWYGSAALMEVNDTHNKIAKINI